MLDPQTQRRRWLAYALLAWLSLSYAWTLSALPAGQVLAQEADSEADALRGPAAGLDSEVGSEALDEEAFDEGAIDEESIADLERINEEEGINIFALLVKGGWFMIPIGLLSLLVVTVAIERALGLRRARVLPDALVQQLGKLAGAQGSFDPREAYRVCQRYPSAAANVVRAMLLKVGRPHSEVEHTVAEASEREAERLYANVRWLNLAAGVAPLLGLLGTVWGMIDAFHRTTMLGPGQNKAEELATGIYVALVTTFGGLMIAIPAAIFAHLFEGRIQHLFHQIDEMLFNILPQVERFEGRLRFGQPDGDGLKKTGPPEPPQMASSSQHS